MSTDSTNEPSAARHSVLRVMPRSQVSSCVTVSSAGSRAVTSASRPAAGRSVISAGRLGQPAEVVPGQLVGTVGRMPKFGDGGAAAGGVQIGQVRAAGRADARAPAGRDPPRGTACPDLDELQANPSQYPRQLPRDLRNVDRFP